MLWPRSPSPISQRMEKPSFSSVCPSGALISYKPFLLRALSSRGHHAGWAGRASACLICTKHLLLSHSSSAGAPLIIVITVIVVIAYYPISAPMLLRDGEGLGCRSVRLQRAKPCLLFRTAERCKDTSPGLLLALLESFEVLGKEENPSESQPAAPRKGN